MAKPKEYYAHQARTARAENIDSDILLQNKNRYGMIRDKLLNDIKEAVETQPIFCYEFHMENEPLSSLFIPSLIRDLKEFQFEVTLLSPTHIMIHWNSL
jgi:hypothetical protein